MSVISPVLEVAGVLGITFFAVFLATAAIDAIADFVRTQRAEHVKEMTAAFDLLFKRAELRLMTHSLTSASERSNHSENKDADPS
ncbi:MAG: hypothetical protein U0R19_37835 [Bryobacteraceae bacterium]